MKPRTILRATAMGLALLVPAACGDASSEAADGPPAAASTSEGPSPVELEQGFGPVRDLELGPVDPALAAQGETLFTTKCSACHRLGERYVAPPLGDVLSRRRPEFVMNMMLNANEMVQKHPVVRELLAEYFTPMPVQVTDVDQARAVLEYLRSAQTGPVADPSGSTDGR